MVLRNDSWIRFLIPFLRQGRRLKARAVAPAIVQEDAPLLLILQQARPPSNLIPPEAITIGMCFIAWDADPA